MIRKSGIGVAMNNAIDEVKAVANYICDSNNNDGVANWLANYLLGAQA
jgi:hydroxymethylpyrimidine pyrophosphatase-like HAD family hydrolase